MREMNFFVSKLRELQSKGQVKELLKEILNMGKTYHICTALFQKRASRKSDIPVAGSAVGSGRAAGHCTIFSSVHATALNQAKFRTSMYLRRWY